MDKLEKIKQYIINNFHKDDLNNSYHDYGNNPRLDDCFDGGYEKGVAETLEKILELLKED